MAERQPLVEKKGKTNSVVWKLGMTPIDPEVIGSARYDKKTIDQKIRSKVKITDPITLYVHVLVKCLLW